MQSHYYQMIIFEMMYLVLKILKMILLENLVLNILMIGCMKWQNIYPIV